MTIVKQLTLGVGLKDETTFANFYAAENSHLITQLKKTAQGQGENLIYFCGPSGEGRTHLLQACCHLATLTKLRSVYLPLANFKEFSPAIFDELESMDLICIDDVDKIAGLPQWEEAFFHTYNRIHDAKVKLIVSANVLPKAVGFLLPDIVSRLSWGMVFPMHTLTHAHKLQVMILRAQQRGLTLTDEVAKFILNHCPRHMTTLVAALDALDKISLAAQRKLTIPFVKSVLQI